MTRTRSRLSSHPDACRRDGGLRDRGGLRSSLLVAVGSPLIATSACASAHYAQQPSSEGVVEIDHGELLGPPSTPSLPWPEDTPTQAAEPEAHAPQRAQWVTQAELLQSFSTHDGYSADYVIQIGEPSTNDVSHPDDSSFLAGSACDYDPSKDIVIPFIRSSTNTTDGFASRIDNSVALQTNSNSLGYLEVKLSTGALCSGASLGVGSARQLLIRDDVEPGRSVVTRGVVILKDYFSPAHPAGDDGLLSRATLALGMGGDDLHLDGTICRNPGSVFQECF